MRRTAHPMQIEGRKQEAGRVPVIKAFDPAWLAAIGVGKRPVIKTLVAAEHHPSEAPVMWALRYMVEKAAISPNVPTGRPSTRAPWAGYNPPPRECRGRLRKQRWPLFRRAGLSGLNDDDLL